MISFSTPWSEETYKDFTYRVIVPLEEKGGKPSWNVYIDSNGFATVGAGFLVSAQAKYILKTLFLRYGIIRDPDSTEINEIVAAVTENGVNKKFASNDAAQSAINKALPTALKDATKSFTFANNDEVNSTFHQIRQQFEKLIDSKLPSTPLTRERLALLSLGYNAILAKSPTLINDVGTLNDRADAWYQIRYDSNGGKNPEVGIAKRRFYESSLFGLSADLNAPTLAEAQQAYSLFYKRHGEILEYEKLWGQLPSGQRAINKDKNGRTAIEAATQDYAAILKDANLSATNTATLDNQLNPLKNTLLNNLRTGGQLSAQEVAALPANDAVKATALYMELAMPDVANNAPAVNLNAEFFESYYGKDGSNDLLIGSSLGDLLRGGKDNDLTVCNRQGDTRVDEMQGMKSQKFIKRQIVSWLFFVFIFPAKNSFAVDSYDRYMHKSVHRDYKLIIRKKSENRFEYELDTNYQLEKNSTPNIGYFSGVASLKGGVALSKNGNFSDDCYLIFEFISDSKVKIKSFGNCYYGGNAYPDVEYQKVER